ncbi:MAG: hypothetical protein IJ282_08995 [Lachnospiraceae bacterium]|nr:hypothetical protein [Lachnospiraceae bacterium]
MAIWKRIKKYRDMDVDEEAEKKISQLEKGDMSAMIFSALLVLWIPALLILILICALAYLFLGFPFAS